MSLSPERCAAILEGAANFFDRRREVGCNRLEISLPDEADRPRITLDLFASDEEIVDQCQEVGFFTGLTNLGIEIGGNMAVAETPLQMDRPYAGFALRALRSVVLDVPSYIETAGGLALDWPLTAPSLAITCHADTDSLPRMAEFLGNQEIKRDELSTPYILTSYKRHGTNDPIAVKLDFQVPGFGSRIPYARQ